MQTIRIQTSQNIEVEYQLAGLGDRLVAFIVDFAIRVAYIFVLLFVVGALAGVGGGDGIEPVF
ncbi:MAG: RDD family protein, partial [Bacteroidetes bacterium]|nr:RDD family protein [Bacteroidota bacterium]